MRLSYQSLVRLTMEGWLVLPAPERTVANGMTFGIGPSGIDVRIRQSLVLKPGEFVLASTIETLRMPANVAAQLMDKSTLARTGINLLNTYIEPGFVGGLTLEIKNLSDGYRDVIAGQPIGQLIFDWLDWPTEKPYSEEDKYQNQTVDPQPAIFVKGESR